MSPARAWSRLAAALLVSLLAACPPPDDVVPAAPAPDAGAPVLATLQGLGQAPEEALVCLLLPATGPAADRAADMLAGMEVARADLDARPTRRRIRFRRQDPGPDEASAERALATCVRGGASMIVGPVDPARISALAPVIALNEAAALVPAPGAARLEPWPANLVAVRPTSRDIGAVAARDALARGAGEALVLAVDDGHGRLLASAFETTFAAAGGAVRVRSLDPGQPASWADAVGGPGSDAVFLVGPPEPARAVAALLAERPGLVLWVTDWAMEPGTLAAADAGRDRLRGVQAALLAPDFEATYEQRIGRPATDDAAAGHDALRLAVEALEAAPTLWWEDVASTLRSQQGVPSAFGGSTGVVDQGEPFLEAAGHRVFRPGPDGSGWEPAGAGSRQPAAPSASAIDSAYQR